MSHHEHKPSVFLQLHLLVNHGPANPNRDDEGRPKIATVGGVERMRLSSQSIKRAVRMGEAFQEGLAEENLGKRTRRAGFAIQEALAQAGADEQAALCYATATARVFGHLDGSGAMPGNKQLAFITGSEMSQAKEVAVHAWRTATDRDASASDIINIPEQAVQEIAAAAKSLLGQDGKSLEKALDALNKGNPVKQAAGCIYNRVDEAVDVGMFGRMLADLPHYNREAAVQVAHAVTTHKVRVEDDFYTAVDDMKATGENQDSGSGFMGVSHFGAGVFYQYSCVDVTLLKANLDGNVETARSAVGAYIKAACTTAPTGKQNSFASRAFASYAMVERGQAQGRQLSAAFLRPVDGETPDGILTESVRRLQNQRDRMENAYKDALPGTEARIMNVETGEGSLSELIEFAKEAVQ